jgi:hypothetical protein
MDLWLGCKQLNGLDIDRYLWWLWRRAKVVSQPRQGQQVCRHYPAGDAPMALEYFYQSDHGSKVVTNENVGITSVQDWEDPEALRSMIDKAGETFWRLVQQ